MICEAEKQAAESASALIEEGIAQSVRLPYGAVQKAVDASIPLRRPVRRQLSSEAEKELYLKMATENAKAMNLLDPKGVDLRALLKRFPAPQDWYEE